jgi:peroxiredoxin
MPYLDLARLVRYEDVSTTLNDPLLANANQILAETGADVQKADFTLRDTKNKKVTLSELRGKIVMVNFWATWCNACTKEMPDLDVIYTHFQSQGLIILSITDENGFPVIPFITQMGYHPPVLFDTGSKVHKLFHVDGDPKNCVFRMHNKHLQSTDECIDRNQDAMYEYDSNSHQLFHVDGMPKSFVFDPEGKLVAQSIGESTQHQLLMMLARAGLHP